MLTSKKLAISRSSSTDQRRGGGGHQQELYSDNNNNVDKIKKKKNMGLSSELQVSSSFNDNNNNDRRSSGIRGCVVNVVGFGEEEEEEEDSSELNLGLSLNSMITKNRKLMGLRNDHHLHHPIEDHDDDDHNNNDDDDQLEMRSVILEKRSEMSSRRNRSSTRVGRILTARDFPCLIPSMGGGGSGGGFSAGKIREDAGGGGGDSPQEVNSGTSNQVVGWPPIGAYRMNSLANTQSKNTVEENSGKNRKNHVVEIPKITVQEDDESQAQSRSMFVKVNMDGVPIGRKVDLSNHVSYETLALALEDMFKLPSIKREHGMRGERRRLSLLNGNSEYALTYEDREGDWMLVGDVPWRMFFTSVRRLRIMKTSEASGLGR